MIHDKINDLHREAELAERNEHRLATWRERKSNNRRESDQTSELIDTNDTDSKGGVSGFAYGIWYAILAWVVVATLYMLGKFIGRW